MTLDELFITGIGHCSQPWKHHPVNGRVRCGGARRRTWVAGAKTAWHQLGREIPLVPPCRMGHRSPPSYYVNLAHKPWTKEMRLAVSRLYNSGRLRWPTNPKKRTPTPPGPCKVMHGKRADEASRRTAPSESTSIHSSALVHPGDFGACFFIFAGAGAVHRVLP